MNDPVSQNPAAAASPRPSRAQPATNAVHFSERPILGASVLGAQRKRLGGAFGLSLVSHICAVLLAIVLASLVPQAQHEPFVPAPNYEIVWLPAEGPGGGGGGGGNESPEPPRKVELPGEDRISVPVARKPPVEPPPPKPEPEPEPPAPEQEMNIPALTLGSGEQTLAGVLDGLPSADISSQGAGTGGGGGTGRGTGIGPGEGSGLGPGTGGGTGGGVYRPGSGIQQPRILREVKPQYTADAMRAKVQGVVLVECVVLPDGTVGDVRVVRSLDPVFGLDQEAVKAVRQWRFAPGIRMGQPVPVLVSIELTFTLR